MPLTSCASVNSDYQLVVGFRPPEFKLVSLYELVTAHLGPLANDHFWRMITFGNGAKVEGMTLKRGNLASADCTVDVEYPLHRIFMEKGCRN